MIIKIGDITIEADNARELVEQIYKQRIWQENLSFEDKLEILIDSLNRFTDLDISKHIVLAGNNDEVKASRLIAALKDKEILEEI